MALEIKFLLLGLISITYLLFVLFEQQLFIKIMSCCMELKSFLIYKIKDIKRGRIKRIIGYQFVRVMVAICIYTVLYTIFSSQQLTFNETFILHILIVHNLCYLITYIYFEITDQYVYPKLSFIKHFQLGEGLLPDRNYEEAKKIIRSFLKCNLNSRFLLLNGEWGSGKTYLLAEALEDNFRNKNSTKNLYFYESYSEFSKYSDELIEKLISNIFSNKTFNWTNELFIDLSESELIQTFIDNNDFISNFFKLFVSRKNILNSQLIDELNNRYKFLNDNKLETGSIFVIIDDIDRASSFNDIKNLLGFIIFLKKLDFIKICIITDWIRLMHILDTGISKIDKMDSFSSSCLYMEKFFNGFHHIKIPTLLNYKVSFIQKIIENKLETKVMTFRGTYYIAGKVASMILDNLIYDYSNNNFYILHPNSDEANENFMNRLRNTSQIDDVQVLINKHQKHTHFINKNFHNLIQIIEQRLFPLKETDMIISEDYNDLLNTKQFITTINNERHPFLIPSDYFQISSFTIEDVNILDRYIVDVTEIFTLVFDLYSLREIVDIFSSIEFGVIINESIALSNQIQLEPNTDQFNTFYSIYQNHMIKGLKVAPPKKYSRVDMDLETVG